MKIIHFPVLVMKFVFIFFLFVGIQLNAQTVQILSTGTETSLRGLSVVSDKIIWASGTNGTVSKSVNGGASWKWLTVKDYEKTDFRDIEAFDSSTAIIMAIGEPALILKTTDGGQNWKVVYENKTKGMFLDAMDFIDKENGIVTGDPVAHKFFISQTFNGGSTWQDMSANNRPVADSGEACFAASGSNIKLLANHHFILVSGGIKSRLFISGNSTGMPILQGKESTGANSIAIRSKQMFMVTGGDFATPGASEKNCVITYDKGITWQHPVIPPHGYRSCVEYLEKNNWITCGLNGVDYSGDDGKTWQWISKESFHVCKKARPDKHRSEDAGQRTVVFLAGPNGKIGKIVYP